MKRGFTLIELLAVIVILAIIALIATPIVLNIINDTKESSTISSADFYADAIDNAIANKLLKDSKYKMEDGVYSIMSAGNICIGALAFDECTGNILEVEVKGEVPNSGSIEVLKGTINNFNFIYPNNRVIIEDEKLVKKELMPRGPNGEICGDANSDGIVTQVDADLIFEYVANWDIEIDIKSSDVDGSLELSPLDSTYIMQYLRGWDVDISNCGGLVAERE